VIEHADPRIHPVVHVALEGDHHFLRAEVCVILHPLDRLPLVELLVVFRETVDVVQRAVVVHDLQRLADHDADHVRECGHPF